MTLNKKVMERISSQWVAHLYTELTIGFGSAMGSPFPDDKMFPQLNMDNFDADKHLRPPYMIPPKLARSSKNFEDILNCILLFWMVLMVDMQGYEMDIKSDIHRRNLIKDSRFYNLRHLTESLVPAKTYHNPFRGNAAEILLSINDFRAYNSRIGWVEGQSFGWMEYKRPHDIDKEFQDLVIQIDDDGIVVGGGRILLINRQAIKSVKNLKETAEGRKSETHPGALLGGHEEMAIRCEIPNECHCLLDGEEQPPSIFLSMSAPPPPAPAASENGEESSSKKRKLSEGEQESTSASVPSPPQPVLLKRSIWRVKVRGQPPPASSEVAQSFSQPIGGRRVMILVGVKLQGWSREREFSKELTWL
jgi:hypothetical protein